MRTGDGAILRAGAHLAMVAEGAGARTDPSGAGHAHATSELEQRRLIQQAALLAPLLRSTLELGEGERLLEIGRAVGAVPGLIGREAPHGPAEQPRHRHRADRWSAALSGDAEPERGGAAARRRRGPALPWPEWHFDRVRLLWVGEHLEAPLAELREAQRVLRPGGTIHLTETDHGSLQVSPPDGEIAAFLEAFMAHFHRRGDAHAGPRLRPQLERAGFAAVDKCMQGLLHVWSPGRRRELRRFCTYLLGFSTPELPDPLAAAPSPNEAGRITEATAAFSISVHPAIGRVPDRYTDGCAGLAVVGAFRSAWTGGRRGAGSRTGPCWPKESPASSVGNSGVCCPPATGWP